MNLLNSLCIALNLWIAMSNYNLGNYFFAAISLTLVLSLTKA